MTHHNIGIIDIGSNSVRLVIYETEPGGAYRIIYENKYSARLSRLVQPDGRIPRAHLQTAVTVLRQFRAICEAYRTIHIRAAATAAIRNAANSEDIIRWLEADTGLTIECVSGDKEAYYGFLGVLQSMDIQDGMIIDIGGGSTEITLFRNRKRLNSISLPIGAVNAHARYGTQEVWTQQQVRRFREEISQALEGLDWIKINPGLPLIGLGGTIRTMAKMHQKRIQYSLPVTHYYEMKSEAVDQAAETLPFQSFAQRKKVPGLSKERANLIVPGLLILQTIFRTVKADRYIVSGAGVRDGLFREWIAPDEPAVPNALKASIRNILAFGPSEPEAFGAKSYEDMVTIYEALTGRKPDRNDAYVMYTAAMLHASGILVNYYKSSQHSAYRILFGGIYGLSHRQTVLSAIAADYHPKKRTPQLLEQHRDILEPADTQRAHRLGSLLYLAKALRSSLAVKEVTAAKHNGSLRLQLYCAAEPLVEESKLEDAAKDLEDAWDVKLTWTNLPASIT
ncbi:Ppx/GppA phosphatase family protein [Paenibacillus caui]|uniref:Ppx/GppA phosphatase family protein n=1 Tax=Paenibacillus caui TaxID=2873927 RepID=UPI001CA8CE14|nr:Ppx/GppA phosphatase family protein [Paenibacillus caui]